jgi:hypothetical protein
MSAHVGNIISHAREWVGPLSHGNPDRALDMPPLLRLQAGTSGDLLAVTAPRVGTFPGTWAGMKLIVHMSKFMYDGTVTTCHLH